MRICPFIEAMIKSRAVLLDFHHGNGRDIKINESLQID